MFVNDKKSKFLVGINVLGILFLLLVIFILCCVNVFGVSCDNNDIFKMWCFIFWSCVICFVILILVLCFWL